MPFYYSEDLQETIKKLQEKGVCVYAAHLKGQQFYHKLDYCKGTAFLIGNEGNGLKEETAQMADCYLKIPMVERIVLGL